MEEEFLITSSGDTTTGVSLQRNIKSDDNSENDVDPSNLLDLIKDDSPFTCDLAAVVEECISSTVILTDDEDLSPNSSPTVITLTSLAPSPLECPSSSIELPIVSRKGKKRRRKPRNSAAVAKIYSCDWCHRASFKSGQGLRFHKTIRCPAREDLLGERYFRCESCSRAFVTKKGLSQHSIEIHGDRTTKEVTC